MIRLAIATALILAAPSSSTEPAATAAMPAGTLALSGPPWISIESPPNPYNSETRGALLVVRVYHHGEAAYYPVSGTAEGLQGGKRQSVKLQFGSTSTPGMYSLKFARPSAGAWLLMIHVGEDGDHGQATAVVSLDGNGQVASVQVPTKQEGDWLMPRELTEAEVSARLRGLTGA